MKSRSRFACTECGTTAPRWLGRCPGCGSWNTLTEEAVVASAPDTPPPVAPVPITEVAAGEGAHRPTGLAELDRVLGGGFVPGSVTLLSGEPGIGKSTLVLQVLGSMAWSGEQVLLATAEESAEQVRLRAERLGPLDAGVHVMAETVLPHILAAARAMKPSLLVVDSIQTVYDPDLESAPGSVSQVRDAAAHVVRLAKEDGVTTVLVGHVTKEGVVAGPRVLEHLVDTVLNFEGDANHALRLLRASKNRFGSTGEVGIFEMREAGLAGVEDASTLFLADRRPDAPGSVVAAVMEGTRPLLVEIQALVTASTLAMPRRSLSGLDPARVGLLAGILEKRLGFRLSDRDLYAQAAGGVRVNEPAADLAIALALVSASMDVPVADGVVAVGEVGLGGEVRRVPSLRRRLAEAARLGFSRAVVPAATPGTDLPLGPEPLRAGTLRDAIHLAGIPLPPEADAER